MSVFLYHGSTALSGFRLQRLQRRLTESGAGIVIRCTRWAYLVDAKSNADDERLQELLGADGVSPSGPVCYVMPRLGTVSPWSSKATDIAHACGFRDVQRVERGVAYELAPDAWPAATGLAVLHDPMTESVLPPDRLASVFAVGDARPLRHVPLIEEGLSALRVVNREWGLALSSDEITYLGAHFQKVGRNPTDAELMMFAQVNSEHCRHKIFNAEFVIDGRIQRHSPFGMIRLTHEAAPEGVLSAYKDNAAVVAGPMAGRWLIDRDRIWRMHHEPVHLLMKVETHNHPTGISPHPGAATGAGGEIRDEAATGCGGRPKAGLCGFSVSNLRIPGFGQPWESDDSGPDRMASALQIMTEAPVGAAGYCNEFGRPTLCGYFRTLEVITPDGLRRGYHKPVMIAGGCGNIRPAHVEKRQVPVGARLVVLGGPAMLIGLGGGAASSMATGDSTETLDFASVQRANPELERRCQEVIDSCCALDAENPILSIHDVGAGGLSNALPELIHADARGGLIHLRDIQIADHSLSPMEIWCNESQERYVLAIAGNDLEQFEAICVRERCPWAVVGEATGVQMLELDDPGSDSAVDMPMSVLFGRLSRMQRSVRRLEDYLPAMETSGIPIDEAVRRVLRLPAVADKSFLITIGDRTVGGLTVRDQMVGPWQIPVSDCAVTAAGFGATAGEAMAMGERPLLALMDAAASARMAVAEAITNIAAARIRCLSNIRLSANWMAAAGSDDEDARLYDAVRAVGEALCPSLGIAIPVGKDSLSMRTVWEQQGEHRVQTAPVTVNVSAFAPVDDVRGTLTPQLRLDAGESRLLLVDIGGGKNRLGGSALFQAFGAREGRLGGLVPDLDDHRVLIRAFDALQSIAADQRLLAYHDRSDGGVFAALCEMAMAGGCGLEIEIGPLGDDPITSLFAEELGMLLQVRKEDAVSIHGLLVQEGLRVVDLGRPHEGQSLRFFDHGRLYYEIARRAVHQYWSETSYRMAALRDDPECAREAFDLVGDPRDPGLNVHCTFDPSACAPAIATSRPPVAILREQGVNGHAEMAYAFHAVGFEPRDVHMSELISGQRHLEEFVGLAACGGFSYGDVLGAGQGWARSILFNPYLRKLFADFFARTDRFALGVCNGCQMLAALKELVPGAANWPAFHRNRSEQFEARWSLVEVLESQSVFFAGMQGSRFPVAVAHGEGRVVPAHPDELDALGVQRQVTLRFIDNCGHVAKRYPSNPNGSPHGITGLCNADGRITIMMPHPERTLSTATGSWWPESLSAVSPWLQLFRNARAWVG